MPTKARSKKNTFKIQTSVERIKPGRWFMDGGGRKFMKLQDILPSGVQQTYLRIEPHNCFLISDFAINAVDESGCTGCCPYGMDIFCVQSEDDLYHDGTTGPTVRHIPYIRELREHLKTLWPKADPAVVKVVLETKDILRRGQPAPQKILVGPSGPGLKYLVAGDFRLAYVYAVHSADETLVDEKKVKEFNDSKTDDFQMKMNGVDTRGSDSFKVAVAWAEENL